jgi:hypothetical protein
METDPVVVIPESPCVTARALAITFARPTAVHETLKDGIHVVLRVSLHACGAATEGDKLSSSCYDWRVWWVNMAPTHPALSSPADVARASFYEPALKSRPLVWS